MPKRVQIQSWRKRGGKKPDNVVIVARPSKWGNPWTVQAYMEAGYKPTREQAQRVCVDAFEAWMKGEQYWAHGTGTLPPPDPAELRGKDLACYCKLDEPCHADVLLELANRSDDDA